MEKPKVVVIVGPTASGKTSLSIEIAKKFDGEVISADSRQVYRGLDLGSGKVTTDEMNGVPHHLLDVADPSDTYTAADFKKDAREAIKDIVSRNKLPIVAGGTFLYVDTLIGRIQTPEVPPNPALREKLEAMSEEILYSALLKADERRALLIDQYNKRRLIRALEIVEAIGMVPPTLTEEPYKAIILGIQTDKEELHENIHKRLIERIDDGMIEEVQKLHKQGLSYERMDDLGLEYRYIAKHLQGELSKDEMLEELEIKIRQFAKRQMTWLKRDKTIRWFTKDDIETISTTVRAFLD